MIGELALEARGVGTFGQPQAAAPGAEAPACEVVPVASCSRSAASVASSGSTAWVAADVHSSTPSSRRKAPTRSRHGARRPVRRTRSRPQLGAPRRPARARPALEPRCILGVDGRSDLAQEAQVALPGVAAHGFELVAEHGGQAHGHGRAVEQIEERQVRAGHRLPQPFLAERPGAETLHVGHVGMEYERQRARTIRIHAGNGLG